MALAETATARQVEFVKCEDAVSNGKMLANASSSYEDTSYWVHNRKYYRLKISSLNLFNLNFVCEELSISK